MRAILCLYFTFVALAWCDETADRAAIEKIIATLNDPQNWTAAKPSAHLFTSNADVELARLSTLVRRMMELSKKPWSEVSNPRFAIQSIRFVTPGVALADASVKQYGSVILARRVPVLFVMKKEGAHWRIAFLRVLVAFGAWPSDSDSVSVEKGM